MYRFKNSITVFTSSEKSSENENQIKIKIIEDALKKSFRPEFRRLDEIVVDSINIDQQYEVAKSCLKY